jgi:hypothetical protein
VAPAKEWVNSRPGKVRRPQSIEPTPSVRGCDDSVMIRSAQGRRPATAGQTYRERLPVSAPAWFVSSTWVHGVRVAPAADPDDAGTGTTTRCRSRRCSPRDGRSVQERTSRP